MTYIPSIQIPPRLRGKSIPLAFGELSNEKKDLVVEGIEGMKYYPGMWGFIMNHYKDPYSTTSIMESETFFFVDQLAWGF